MTGSITFSTAGISSDEPYTPDNPESATGKDMVFKESFESADGSQLTANIIFGEGEWSRYKKGDFVMNADQIPEATDGRSIMMLFAGKGNLLNEAEVISTVIDIEPGKNYTMAFDLFIEGSSTTLLPTFSMFVEDEYGEYNIFTSDKTTDGWQNVECPLTFAGNKIRYKLYGKVYSGGIFIDNIRFCKDVEPASVSSITNRQNTPAAVYRLNGTQTGGCKLRRGLNIIRDSDGQMRKIMAK